MKRQSQSLNSCLFTSVNKKCDSIFHSEQQNWKIVVNVKAIKPHVSWLNSKRGQMWAFRMIYWYLTSVYKLMYRFVYNLFCYPAITTVWKSCCPPSPFLLRMCALHNAVKEEVELLVSCGHSFYMRWIPRYLLWVSYWVCTRFKLQEEQFLNVILVVRI